jgi:hypothetical protein
MNISQSGELNIGIERGSFISLNEENRARRSQIIWDMKLEQLDPATSIRK